MAKINKAAENSSPSKPTAKTQSTTFSWSLSNLIPLGVCLLYFMVHFIPDFGAYDAMGSQWFYLVVADLLVVILLLSRKKDYLAGTSAIFSNLFSKLYLVFFGLAGISIITAINPTEAWVNFSRLTATVIAFFNIAILLYGRTDLFRLLAQLLGLILLVESYQTITQFLNGFTTMGLTELIMSIKGTTGNKNIFAAGIVVKIPFVLYCIHRGRLWSRILNIFILVTASLSIFILNARATYLSLLLILALYLIYCILGYLKERKTEQILYRIGYIFIPVIIAFFISQIEFSTIKQLQEEKGEQNFGSVTERLASVAQTNDESNQVRVRLWAHALDYTKQHPLMGCGIGNWKIASIPYQRTITNDLYVPIHAHNDYLEVFAELGIPGGLIYLSLFVCILVFTIKTYRAKVPEEIQLISVFSFLAFTGYSLDALFNFPMERPLSQVFFAFSAACNVVAYLKAREEAGESKPAVHPVLTPFYGLLAILLLIPSCYVTYLNYQSLIVQKTVLGDLNNEPLKLDWKEVVPSFPPIPNLSATAQPIEAIKGRYLYEAGQNEEALALLNKGRSANPVIGYSEFLKAGLYYKMGKYDSAVTNATFAFYVRPKAKTYYQTLIAVLAKTKDTMGIKKAFAEYDRYRHHALGWDLYLRGMLNAQGKGSRHLLAMADSALKMFGKQEDVSTIVTVRDEIIRFMENPVINSSSGNAGNVNAVTAAKYYNEAVAAFGTGVAGKDNLEKAASLFLKSANLNPANYVAYENAAICYFNLKQWQQSITYFNKVLATNLSANGKPEYFKGVALYNLGQKEEGCNYLRTSLAKGWKEAEAIIKANCK